MLRLISGRSGSGRSYTVTEEIRALVKAAKESLAANGSACYLIVPEQMSFETEKRLMEALGEADAAHVRVWSFTRMAERLLPSTSRSISVGARVMLMGKALSETADFLEIFKTNGAQGDVVSSLLQIAAECKQAGVLPEAMQEAAASLPAGILSQKVEELSRILTVYDALLSLCGEDTRDTADRLAEWLRENRALSGAAIFADGFKSFTAPEMQVLEALMAQADAVTVTLCTDRLQDDSGGLDRFSVVMETARRLKTAAARVGCQVAPVEHLFDAHRFEKPSLAVLEATEDGCVFRGVTCVAPGDNGDGS